MATGALNPSFETPGTEYGQAESWTESYTACGEDVATFFYHDGPRRPYENFESSWQYNHNYQWVFLYTDIVSAFFCGDAVPYENFEGNWYSPGGVPGLDNAAALFTFVPLNHQVAVFSDGGDEEDFENDWGVSPFNQNYDPNGFNTGADARLTAAAFDAGGENYEDFEESWQSNETYDADGFNANGAEPKLTAALFLDGLGGTTAYETFNAGWTTTLP